MMPSTRSAEKTTTPEENARAGVPGWPTPIGHCCWALPEGYVPASSTGPEPQMRSHETLCLLNASARPAEVALHVLFCDREPAGPYRVRVPARRTLHLRLDELREPEPIPVDTDFATVIVSDTPIVVQHTRLDSRQSENALLSTLAYAAVAPTPG